MRLALVAAALAAALAPATAQAKLSLEFDRQTARPGDRVRLDFGEYFTSTRNVVHVYLVRAPIIGDVVRPALGGGASRLGPPARRAGVHEVGRTLSGRSGITFRVPRVPAGRYAAVIWCSTCGSRYLLAAHQGGIPDDAYVRPTRTLLTVVREEVPTRTCQARIEAGDAPLRFPDSRSGSIFAGPLAFSGFFAKTVSGLGPRRENGRFFAKVGALVRAGKPVVLSVPERYRSRLFLHYSRTDRGEPVVRIEPCSPSTRAFSYAGRVGPVTGFSGGFELTHPGCYPLDVRVVGGRAYRVRIPLGRPCR